MLVTRQNPGHPYSWPKLQSAEKCFLVQADVPISRSRLLERNRHHVLIPSELPKSDRTHRVVKAMCHATAQQYVGERPQAPYGNARQTTKSFPPIAALKSRATRDFWRPQK